MTFIHKSNAQLLHRPAEMQQWIYLPRTVGVRTMLFLYVYTREERADKNSDTGLSGDTLRLTLLSFFTTKPLLPWWTQAHWIYPDTNEKSSHNNRVDLFIRWVEEKANSNSPSWEFNHWTYSVLSTINLPLKQHTK